jgi:1-deoxy-D-xylulose-5-phosphate reductoisomerase
MRNISILGSTGSIGRQTLEVIQANSSNFQIIGLSAGRNLELFKKQILKFKPKYISIAEEKEIANIEAFLNKNNLKIPVFCGDEGLNRIATLEENELLVVSIVGTSALQPTYLAIQEKIPICIACKEVLVIAGKIIMGLAKKLNVPIMPIDSEHAAILQCLHEFRDQPEKISKVTLTASGGPFWKKPLNDFQDITLSDALKHPNWSMGQKITIDSSTLINKGLEVIEAHYLFDIPFEKINVIIHPQSIVHSFVEFIDGNIVAHLGAPDMRFPIQYAILYPDKIKNNWPKLDLAEVGALNFYKPDLKKFPLLQLAYDVGKKGESSPVVMNSANEAAVQLFLNKKISFLDINKIVINSVDSYNHKTTATIQEIIDIDVEIKEKIFSEYK